MKTAVFFLLIIGSLTLSWTTRRFSLNDGSELITMRIQPNKVSCEQNTDVKKCFMVQKGASIGKENWEILNEPITGFEFEEGFTYDIQVRASLLTVSNTKTKLVYQLVKVLDKKKA